MAIKGIILENSYAVVDNVSLSKENKSFNFDFIVYKDITKKDIILKNNYNITPSHICTYPANVVTKFEQYEVNFLNFIANQLKDTPLDITEVDTEQKITTNPQIIILNNPSDSESHGFYEVDVSVHNVIKDNIVESKDVFSYRKKSNLHYYFSDNNYYRLTDNGFVIDSGHLTDHFFQNNITLLLSHNENILGIAYSVLKKIDTFYADYENV